MTEEADQNVTEQNAPNDQRPEPSAEEKAYVSGWTKRIASAKKHWEKTAFKRMRICMQIARDGGTKEWVGKNDEDGNYVAPVISRHINQSVAQLYAKNPKAFVERKKRRMHTVWDGNVQTLQTALLATNAAATVGQPADPVMQSLIEDVAQVQRYTQMIDGLADTLTILHAHFMHEQAANYKQQFKAMVRRAKVVGAGYVTLGLQRLLEPRPEITGRIEDTTRHIALVEQRLREASRDELPEESAKLEELRVSLATLQGEQFIIAREGPVLGFPKSTAIILDPGTTHLKTLTGTGWWAEEMEMTPEEVERTFKVDIRGKYKQYTPDGERKRPPWWSEKRGQENDEPLALVYRVQHKDSGVEFFVCDGCEFYLKPPAAPDVKIERFFTLFPLVFNEVEDEDDIFPPSDVWLARHTQSEYNRARQGLREHRMANRPAWFSPTAAFSDPDKLKISGHAAGELIELGSLTEGDDIRKKLMGKPTVPIDPGLYEVESHYGDMLRVVGSQAANQGVTRGDTATETSIAENSRQVAEASQVDDLDELLSELSRSMGQLMLSELSKDTVVEIVGPGAVWPEFPETRSEIVKDITLDIRAGSSGRPNRAADLANMERGMPFILQMPGINPTPFNQRFLELLDIDVENGVVEGLPSIVAINAQATKAAAAQPGTGDPATDPASQGPQGANNAPQAQQTAPGPQPAFPAPASEGLTPV